MDLGTGHLLAGALGAAITSVINAAGRWRASRHDTDRADREQLREEWDDVRSAWAALNTKVEHDLRACRKERTELDQELNAVRTAAVELTAEVAGLRLEVVSLKRLVAWYEGQHGNLPPEELAAILAHLDTDPIEG